MANKKLRVATTYNLKKKPTKEEYLAQKSISVSIEEAEAISRYDKVAVKVYDFSGNCISFTTKSSDFLMALIRLEKDGSPFYVLNY